MRVTSYGLVEKWESYHENRFVHFFETVALNGAKEVLNSYCLVVASLILPELQYQIHHNYYEEKPRCCENFIYIESKWYWMLVLKWEVSILRHTVDSRHLELGYLKLCKTRSVYLSKKCILIAFSNHNLALETFLRVQITRSAN